MADHTHPELEERLAALEARAQSQDRVDSTVSALMDGAAEPDADEEACIYCGGYDYTGQGGPDGQLRPDQCPICAPREIAALRAKLSEVSAAAHACGFRDGAADMDKRCAAERDRLAAQVAEARNDRKSIHADYLRVCRELSVAQSQVAELTRELSEERQTQHVRDSSATNMMLHDAQQERDKALADLAAMTERADKLAGLLRDERDASVHTCHDQSECARCDWQTRRDAALAEAQS